VAKEEAISFEGVVAEVLPEGRFRILLDLNQREVLAYTGGKMRKNRIRTLRGDRVTVEMSQYDLDRARLVFRHKPAGSGSGGPRSQRPVRRR
jgi:translation initiation factor IF-1